MRDWLSERIAKYRFNLFEKFLIVISLLLLCFLTIDPWVAHSVRSLDRSAYAFFQFLTDFGRTEWIVIPCVLLMGACYYFSRSANIQRLKMAYLYIISVLFYICVAVCLTGLAASLIKNSIGRARPKFLDSLGAIDFTPFAFRPDFASFPSGHSTTIFAFAMAVALLWSRASVSVFVLAAWVAATRVFIGAHYLSDIIAGMFLGVIGGLFFAHYFAQKNIVFRKHKNGNFSLKGKFVTRYLKQSILSRLFGGRPEKDDEKQLVIDAVNRHITHS